LSNRIVLGIDAGGTFTDFVLVELGAQVRIKIHKTLSTPDAPEKAIIRGMESLGFGDDQARSCLVIVHGSTVATNAALEGKFARTVYISNRGFKDVLSLGRQTRPSLYALEFSEQPEPVPPQLCLETGGRIAADGSILEDLTESDLQELISSLKKLKPDAVAINLLFSFVDDSFEKRITEAINASIPELLVSRSSEVLPVYKEYERGIATWLNAALGPVVSGYVGRLKSALQTPIQIMQSSGETLSADTAAKSAVNLLLSGPAGGLNAIKYIGEQIGEKSLISFDMGGTSTDVALIEGRIATTNEGHIGPYPVGVPMVDMHTIGAGGGSIAYIDKGGILQVGPKSAGADPGPACYGKGGLVPTVTDANIVLGRLVSEFKLADDLIMNVDLAKAAISPLAMALSLSIEETALGIIRIANQHMARALRLISVNRGYDPRDFQLVCFGGAGGLHVCELAESMLMDRAIVPVHGGVLSALGMVVAKKGRQFSKTINILERKAELQAIEQAYLDLESKAVDELRAEGIAEAVLGEAHIERRADIRYVGQSFTLSVAWQGLKQTFTDFSSLHQQRYGYQLDADTEIVNIQIIPKVAGEEFGLPKLKASKPCNVSSNVKVYGYAGYVYCYERSDLSRGQQIVGPCIIKEYSATTYLGENWCGVIDEFGNICLEHKSHQELS
jgi:N-methylhydantoinase A